MRRLCDEKCREFIFNFVREFGDLEYVNIGRVVGSLSQRGKTPGRRDVYIAQVKQQGIKDEIVKIIRMQKWGIREHLDEGKGCWTPSSSRRSIPNTSSTAGWAAANWE